MPKTWLVRFSDSGTESELAAWWCSERAFAEKSRIIAGSKPNNKKHIESLSSFLHSRKTALSIVQLGVPKDTVPNVSSQTLPQQQELELVHLSPHDWLLK
jgi:hypothetical protein